MNDHDRPYHVWWVPPWRPPTADPATGLRIATFDRREDAERYIAGAPGGSLRLTERVTVVRYRPL